MNSRILLIGNTCIKSYLINEAMQIINNDRYYTYQAMTYASTYKEKDIYIASVVPETTYQILSNVSITPLVLENKDIPYIINKTKNPQQTGIDRLMNALAAHKENPYFNNIIVDCGTAISFSVITADAEFCGGSILAGVGTELKALHDNTGLLPEFQTEQIAPFQIADDTKTALLSGVCWGKIGAIKEIISLTTMQLKELNSLPTSITLTGGWGKTISEQLCVTHKYQPELTCAGIIETIKAIKK